MKRLRLSPHLEAPLALVTEKLAWIGVTGSGKSYGASKTAEELWHARAQFVVLDPVGTWYGLRLAKDGKAAGIPVPVFGGLHGDVPLEATGGALVADLIVDKDLSAVLDVSQFDTDADKARFVSAFADRLFHRRKRAPAAMHVFLEEAQEFVPQNPQPGEQLMLHRLHRLQKLGRNFGIGTSLITQRPQETSKKALNQAQTVFVFRLTGSQERKAIKAWVDEHGLEENLLDGLPKMETGTCHVWSPAWLRIFKTIRIAAKATFDASATPQVGVRAQARTLAPIDLERLRKDMAATIQKAKEDDPRELRARIAKLEYQASFRKTLSLPAPKIFKQKVERVEVPVLKKPEIAQLEGFVRKATALAERLTKEASALHASARYVGGHLADVAHPKRLVQPALLTLPRPTGVQITSRPLVRSAPAAPLAAAADNAPTTPQQRILAALVFLQSIKVLEPSKQQVALFVGVSPNSGSYANNLGALRSGGWITYPTIGNLMITQDGIDAAPNVPVPTSTGELHVAVLQKISRPQQTILALVLKVYPEKLTKTELAENIGVAPGSGSYANNLGHLRTLGAITYPATGYVRAADIMFVGEK